MKYCAKVLLPSNKLKDMLLGFVMQQQQSSNNNNIVLRSSGSSRRPAKSTSKEQGLESTDVSPGSTLQKMSIAAQKSSPVVPSKKNFESTLKGIEGLNFNNDEKLLN